MPMKATKRAFLVRVLGEERTKALLAALPRMEAELEDAGIAWKSITAMGEAMQAGKAEEAVIAAPAPGLAGATSFQGADQFQQAADLESNAEAEISTFRSILDNIFADVDLEMAEKLARVEATASDLAKRLRKGGGEKSLEPAPIGIGAAVYVQDLGLASGVKALDAEAATAVKSLEGSPAPAAGIVSDLIRQGAING